MKLEIKKSLFDIKTSISSIEEYLDGKRDFNIFQKTRCLEGRSKERLKLLVKP